MEVRSSRYARGVGQYPERSLQQLDEVEGSHRGYRPREEDQPREWGLEMRIHYVYRCDDLYGNCLYVGRTQHLSVRFRVFTSKHENEKFVAMSWRGPYSLEEASKRELSAIQVLAPKYNKWRISSPGTVGWKHTKESSKNLSTANRNRWAREEEREAQSLRSKEAYLRQGHEARSAQVKATYTPELRELRRQQKLEYWRKKRAGS